MPSDTIQDHLLEGSSGNLFGQGANQGVDNASGGPGAVFEAQPRLRDWGWEQDRFEGMHDRSQRYWQGGMDAIGDWRDQFGRDYAQQMMGGAREAQGMMNNAAMARGFSGTGLRGAHQAGGQMMGQVQSGISAGQQQMDMAQAMAEYEQQQLWAQQRSQVEGIRTQLQQQMFNQYAQDSAAKAAAWEAQKAGDQSIVDAAIGVGSLGMGMFF